MSLPVIGFAGMTHLGLVSASAVAGKGFRTFCYDGDEALVGRLQAGKLPVLEPDLDDLVRGNGDGQVFTAQLADLAACDVVYIAPDVPTDDQGQSDLSGIVALIERVAPALSPQAVMVVLCQVPPGFTRSLRVLPAERLYYQVETLVFGRAVERASRPERYIVGCADPRQPLPRAFRTLLEAFSCPILPMRYESAELAKISINMCLVASISVANTLSELCEKIGADWSEIVPSLKLDKRIGAYSYLKPGLGIAGGNLERDLATVIGFADAHGTDAGVVEAWVRNSRHRRDWAARTIQEVVLKGQPEAVVAVLGLAYKENTHSVKNSPSLATIAQMPGARLQVHDPVVKADVVDHPRCTGMDSAYGAMAGADALMVLTPWPEYRELEAKKVAQSLRGRVVIDPYAVLDGAALVAAGLAYHTLGRPAAV